MVATNILRNNPGLSRDDLEACLAYGRDMLKRRARCAFSPMKMFRTTPQEGINKALAA
jgi:hypothetical protein